MGTHSLYTDVQTAGHKTGIVITAGTHKNNVGLLLHNNSFISVT
jgi:hypothetical protein